MDDVGKEEPELGIYRFTRFVFGLVSSPFVLNATIRSHLSKYGQEDQQFILVVLKSIYVDDFAFSSGLRKAALEIYQKLKICFNEDGFNMRRWLSGGGGLLGEIEWHLPWIQLYLLRQKARSCRGGRELLEI